MSYESLAVEVDKNKDKWISRLREAVEIPSVSAEAAHRDDVFKMIEWTKEKMTALGIQCQLIPNGKQTMPDGSILDLPPVLFGTLGSNKSLKTLLVYGHLDVQPASIEDGWNTPPFKLVEKDGRLYGRGSTDDKGPVVAWLNALEIFQTKGVALTVNLKFVFEGMEESGSLGLEEILHAHTDSFMADVDMTCISDSYWLGKTNPCLTYGLRGISYFGIEVSNAKQDLHSGCHGGAIYEPMNDLVWLLSQLTTVDGKILIEGLNELVAPVTEEEDKLYENIDFNLEEYRNDLGVSTLVSDSKKQILMNRWRFPTLSLHGIEGAFYGPGAKTVIPGKVIGKLSIRLVPNMEIDKVSELLTAHIKKLWSTLGSPCKMEVKPEHAGRGWLSDPNHPHYQAGARALKKVFGVEPDLIREGGSIPVTLAFQDITQKNVLLLPIGACDDMAHSTNEKLDVSNYINGIKTFIAYLLELSSI